MSDDLMRLSDDLMRQSPAILVVVATGIVLPALFAVFVFAVTWRRGESSKMDHLVDAVMDLKKTLRQAFVDQQKKAQLDH